MVSERLQRLKLSSLVLKKKAFQKFIDLGFTSKDEPNKQLMEVIMACMNRRLYER